MTRFILGRLALGPVLAAMAAGPALAHHSAQQFDADAPMNLSGTVHDVQLTNPHSWIMIDTKRANGGTTRWAVEGPSPAALRRIGIARNTVKPGDNITLVIAPDRRGRTEGLLVRLVSVNGQPAPGAAAAGGGR